MPSRDGSDCQAIEKIVHQARHLAASAVPVVGLVMVSDSSVRAP
ncbi:hypothetical protein [Nocardia asiatica]